jgi:hypothetical protein
VKFFVLSNSLYVGNGAAAFDERERITIFSVALRGFLVGEKN